MLPLVILELNKVPRAQLSLPTCFCVTTLLQHLKSHALVSFDASEVLVCNRTTEVLLFQQQNSCHWHCSIFAVCCPFPLWLA